MTRFRMAAVGALTAAVAASSSGTTIEAQPPAPSSTVHSVKITLAVAADKKTCELRALVPEVSGVYRGDTLVWNVENGCTVPVRVVISNVTAVGSPPSQPWFENAEKLRSGSIDSLQRGEIRTRVLAEPAVGTQYLFDYSVRVETPSGIPDAQGRVMICHFPPCWPPSTMKPPPK